MESASRQRRMTRQRRVILDELRRLSCHPSAEELHGIVRRAMPGISLGTVYRNLDVLWKAGKILKLEALGAQTRYDGDIRPHYHARCLQCGRIVDLRPHQVAGVGDPRVLDGMFMATGWRLDFEGLCPACAGNESEAEAC
ncbi:MAG: transcriptional repressor [Candidatus Hydrogenedentes bacterium]|nr:transcriptional repressor [Candidatus Hydrogenedentota bacterium]